MFTGSIIKAIHENEITPISLPLANVIEILAHATAMGFILALATLTVGRHLERRLQQSNNLPPEFAKDIFGSMNLMFLTVGLSGLMVLINNSLLRAFAIVAAISVVRFRVKLDSKALGSAMIFSILAGMACGVGEYGLAYVSLGCFLGLVGILLALVKIIAAVEKPTSVSPADTSPQPQSLIVLNQNIASMDLNRNEVQTFTQ